MDKHTDINPGTEDSLNEERRYRLTGQPPEEIRRRAGAIFLEHDPDTGYRNFTEEVNRKCEVWRAVLPDQLRQDDELDFDTLKTRAATDQDLSKRLDLINRQTRTALGYYWEYGKSPKLPKYFPGIFFIEAANILQKKAHGEDQELAANEWKQSVFKLLECKQQRRSVGTPRHAASQHPSDEEPTATVLYADRMIEFLEQIGPNHIVVLTSGDGFLETIDKDIAESVAKNIRRGLSYWYVFPSKEYGRTGSIEDDLHESVVRRLDSAAEQDRVRFLEVDRSLPAGLGRKQRSVLVLEGESKQVVTAFHYLLAATEYSGKPDGYLVRCWLPMPRADGRDLWQTICDHSRPVFPRVRNGSQATPLQRAYISHFERKNLLDAYDKLKDPFVVEDIASTLSKWASQTREPISILDIGGSDGRVLASILDQCRQRHPGFLARPTIIDAANIQEPHPSIAEYVPETKFDTAFENFNRPSESYDIVLAVHAWYVMDPWQLFRALRLVRSDGMMIVLQATKDSNGLSALSQLVDDHDGAPVVPRARPFGDVNLTPDRVYSEDIWEFFQATLGESPGVTRVRREQSLPSDLFIDSDGALTPTAHQLLAAFCNDQQIASGILKQKAPDDLVPKAARTLAAVVCPENQTIPVHYDMIQLFPAKIRP